MPSLETCPDQLSVGFIGGGNMARSLIGGLIANGFDRDTIAVADPSPEARRYVSENYGVRAEESNRAVIQVSSTVLLAIKPQVMQAVTNEISDALQSARPLLISIAAGIRLSELDRWCGGNLRTVRVMPNTPALIQRGVSAMFANSYVSDDDKATVGRILSAVGKSVWLPDERLLDAVTAISGSGPAYFFYLIESMEQAATQLGLDADTAHLLATETAVGAALLAINSSESPAVLRQRVTSPGGVTEAAFKVLSDANVKHHVISAIQAGEQRSIEMSDTADLG